MLWADNTKDSTVSGSLKAIGPPLRTAPRQVIVHEGCRSGLFVGNFWMWHSLPFTVTYLISAHSFGPFRIYLNSNLVLLWEMVQMNCGQDDNLSLGTKRVASLHWLSGLMLERQGVVCPKDLKASDKLVLVSLPYRCHGWVFSRQLPDLKKKHAGLLLPPGPWQQPVTPEQHFYSTPAKDQMWWGFEACSVLGLPFRLLGQYGGWWAAAMVQGGLVPITEHSAPPYAHRKWSRVNPLDMQSYTG